MAKLCIIFVLITLSASAPLSVWDPQKLFVNSVKECHSRFPDVELKKLRDYLLENDTNVKCFIDCLVRTNGILDAGNRVNAWVVGRWLEAAAAALATLGFEVDAERWIKETEHCATQDYTDYECCICSGAVRVFKCYLQGIPLWVGMITVR